MSIRYAILVFVFFIALCGFLFVSFYEKAKHESIKNLNTQELLHARQAARGIEDFFTNWTTILTGLSETNRIKNMDKTGKENVDSLYKDNSGFLRAITRVDERGRIMYTSPYDRNAIGKDISSQKHMREIMATHRPVVSDVFSTVQGYSAVALHVPVFRDGVYRGTIGAILNFQSLAKRYLEVIKIGKTGYAWVISRDGTELFCPVPGHEGHSVLENCKNFPSILTMVEDMLKGHGGVTTYTFDKIGGRTVDAVKKHAVYMPITIGNTFWSIVVATSEDEVLSSLEGFRNKLIVIISILLLGGALFSCYGLKASFIIREEEKRRHTEEELRASEERYRTIVENTNDAIYINDFEGNIIDVNENACRMVGYTRDELVGANLKKIDSPENSEHIALRTKQLMRDSSILFEGSHIRKDGSLVPIEVSGKVVTREGKGVIQVFIRDISERKRAEEMLHASLEQQRQANMLLDLIVENMPSVIFLKDARDLRFVRINRAAEDMLGYSRDEQQGKNDYDLFPKEQADLFTAHDREVLNRKEIVDIPEESVQTRNKGLRILHTRKVPILDNNGEPEYLLGIAEDITERKYADQALRRSEATLKSVFSAAPIGIIVSRIERVPEWVNEAMVSITGYTAEELKASGSRVLYPTDEEYIRVGSVTLHGTQREGIGIADTKWIHKNGEIRDIHLRAAAIDPSDFSSGVVFTALDISDHKTAEQALQESEAKYRMVVENSIVGVLIIQDSLVRFANRRWCEIYGYDYQEVADKLNPLDTVHPDDRDLVSQNITKRMRGELGPLEYESKSLRKDGRVITVKVFGGTMIYRGKPAAIGTVIDITREKMLESQLRQSQKMEAVGTLAGGVAHDFNNILTAIIGYGSLLQMKMERGDPMKVYADQILTSSQKAVQLTRSLLAFSRKQAIELKPVKINKIIREDEKLLKRLLTEDIELKVTLAESDATVRADANQMDQVLMNLVTNARDAMPKGGELSIETRVVHLDDQFSRIHGFGEPGDYAAISVTDVGIGMNQVTQDKIFEPFFTTKEVGKGTGLGLSTVYGIVKQHNGYITAYSEPGEGTAFTIYLPIIKAQVETTRDTPKEIRGGVETILVAEDNTDVRKLAREVLEGKGYAVIEAADGEDAVRQFTEHQNEIDLLILDVVMPLKNGKEAYDEIRKVRPDMKILFTSGHTGEVVLTKGIHDERINFIPKPLSPNELLTKTREVLDQ